MYSLFPPVSFLSVKTEAPWRAPHIQKKKKKHARRSIINAFLFHSHMSVIFSTDSFGFKLISPACLSGLSS